MIINSRCPLLYKFSSVISLSDAEEECQTNQATFALTSVPQMINNHYHVVAQNFSTGRSEPTAMEAIVGCGWVIAPDVSYANIIFFLLHMMSTTDHYVARHVVNRRVYKVCGGMSAGYQLDARGSV